MQDPTTAPRSYARDGLPKPRRRAGAASAAASSSSSGKTLVDAFKQHGTKLSDGSRLNAVGKGLHAIGSVPPTLAASVSALYLSQNRLRGLAGVEQFLSVRLLSVGGNLLARFEELDCLAALRHLRNLNLVGNPLCDQPNYRFRVIDQLRSLQVLDAADVSKKEREAAPAVAAQDRAMRAMLVRNHFEIHKLQRTAQLIQLHRDFYGFVFAGTQLGRFDRVPGPHDVALDTDRFVRLWDIEEAFPKQARDALEQQMLAIVIRTYQKLSEHPKNKAKEYLVGLASARASSNSQQLDGVPAETHRQRTTWDEAYGSVVSLQQQTMINLQGICARKNQDVAEFMKEFLLSDPAKRSTIARSISRMNTDRLKSDASPIRSTGLNCRADGKDAPASAQRLLPPQQEDPDVLQQEWRTNTYAKLCPKADPERDAPSTSARTSKLAPKRDLPIRNGEFANRTLGEAIHRFALRESLPKAAEVSYPTVSAAGRHQQSVNQVCDLQYQLETSNAISSDCAVGSGKLSLDNLQPRAKQLELPRSTMLFPVYSTRRRESHASTFDGECSSRSDGESDARSVAATSDNTRASHRRNSRTSPCPSIRRYPPLSDPQQSRSAAVRSIRHDPPRFEDEVKASEPADTSQPFLPPPSPPPLPALAAESSSNPRLQELEQREEKYIKALMESEQRELELRSGVCTLQKKLAHYQRTYHQDLEERQKIKREVEARVMKVAAPKVLRRFFVRWVRFYTWALQVHHIRRKRAFIVQYDFFWRWRRTVWVKQQLLELERRRKKRQLWILFGEWANAARLSIIATRSREQQTLRFLRCVLVKWKNAVALSRFLIRRQEQRSQSHLQQLRQRCWCEWKRVVLQRRKVADLHRLRSRIMASSLKQVTLWKWKIYVRTVARPRLVRVGVLIKQRLARECANYLYAWRRVSIAAKRQRLCLIRRVWRGWASSYLATKVTREDQLKHHRVRLRQHFLAWRSTAVDILTSRRALGLAKRYVNQRRLRKLWLHWKFFSITRRKYRQGSTKALKHYFMKLLRSSWRTWKTETSHNLQSIKRTKVRTLRQHFTAFALGIRRAKRQRFQRRMVRHTIKRRRLRLAARCVSAWRCFFVKQKWVAHCGQMLGHQNNLLALGLAWRTWRSGRVQHLAAEASELRTSCDKLVDEKNELEADLMVADDKIFSMQSEKDSLVKQLHEQTNRLAEVERNASVAKEKSAQKEKDHAKTISKLEQCCQDWEQRCSVEANKHEGATTQYQTLKKENRELCSRVAELESALAAGKQAVYDSQAEREKLHIDMDKMRQKFDSEMCSETEKRKALEQDVDRFRSQLTQEQKEREDTANRLQEYERRIATTCEAINQHENEHERDKMRLRCEYAQLEAKWREEHARNSELHRLVGEKNELIRTLRIESGDPYHSSRAYSEVKLSPRPEDEKLFQTQPRSSAQPSPPELPKRSALSPLKPRFEDQSTLPVDELLEEISSSPLLIPSNVGTPSQRGVRSRREAPSELSSRDREGPQGIICSQPVVHSQTHHRTVSCKQEDLVVLEQERLIDERTSKVHDDIRQLQERITKRLEQGALSVSKLMAYRQSVRTPETAKLSLASSCTSLSDDDSGSAVSSVLRFERDKAHSARKKTKLATQNLLSGEPTAPRMKRRTGRENKSDLTNTGAATKTRKSTSATSARRSSPATSTLVASARKKIISK